MLGGRSLVREHRRPRATSSTTTGRTCTWSCCARREAILLGRQHAARPSSPTRRCSRSRRACGRSSEGQAVASSWPRSRRIAVFGAGYVGLVTGRLLRGARARRRRPRRRRREGSTACGAARCRSTSPASTSCSSGTASAPALHDRRRRGGRRRRVRLRRGRHPADLLGRRRSRRQSGRWSTSCRRSTARIVVVMKSTVPVGTGEKVRHRLDERGLDGRRLRLEPGVHGRGDGGPRLHAARPHRRRRVRRGGRRRGRSAPRRHRRAGRPLRRRVGRDDQAGRERRADDPDLVHQRDRERVRGDRRRRRPGRRGGRARPSDRLELPARRDRLRRQLLPEGLARAQAARRQLRLPLPAARSGDRGERAAEAARDRRSSSATSAPLRGKTIALLGLAFKPNTDDMREAPSLVLAGRLLAEGATVRAWDPVATAARPAAESSSSDSAEEALAGADAAVLVTEWPELAELDWAALAATMRTAVLVDGRNMLDPDADAGAGLGLRGHRTRAATGARDGGDRPRGWQGRAARRRVGRTAQVARPDRRASARRVPDRPSAERGRDAGDRQLRCGDEALFEAGLSDLGVERRGVGEPERLGPWRRHSLRRRRATRDRRRVRAERGRAARRRPRWIARCVIARPARRRRSRSRSRRRPSASSISTTTSVTGFREAGRIPYWVNCGVYVLGTEALERFPERGDHETTAFPELAAEGRLRAFRHEGLWLTVNTPKDLRRAEEYVSAHPEWLA